MAAIDVSRHQTSCKEKDLNPEEIHRRRIYQRELELKALQMHSSRLMSRDGYINASLMFKHFPAYQNFLKTPKAIDCIKSLDLENTMAVWKLADDSWWHKSLVLALAYELSIQFFVDITNFISSYARDTELKDITQARAKITQLESEIESLRKHLIAKREEIEWMKKEKKPIRLLEVVTLEPIQLSEEEKKKREEARQKAAVTKAYNQKVKDEELKQVSSELKIIESQISMIKSQDPCPFVEGTDLYHRYMQTHPQVVIQNQRHAEQLKELERSKEKWKQKYGDRFDCYNGHVVFKKGAKPQPKTLIKPDQQSGGAAPNTLTVDSLKQILQSGKLAKLQELIDSGKVQRLIQESKPGVREELKQSGVLKQLQQLKMNGKLTQRFYEQQIGMDTSNKPKYNITNIDNITDDDL